MASSASEETPRVGMPTYVETARWGAWAVVIGVMFGRALDV